jgi:glyoxylase-like metal-dependent hydrolase (beta-lactamase superfamily II)/rhodanese-related sulfurtransferase
MLLSGPAQATEPPATAESLVAAAKPQTQSIDSDQLRQMLEQDPDLYLIDLRTSEEILSLGGSIAARHDTHLPRGWLELRIAERVPDQDTPLVLYCGKDQRAILASATLRDMGYTQVKTLSGGFPAWKAAGLPIASRDLAPNSMLYRLPQQVTDGVYSAIGATQPATYDNSGHNNNLSFVITADGVLVVNAGDNYLLARALHDEIKKLTDQPVRWVVLENGQGHAALGTSYWQEQGATVIAHEDAAHEIEEDAFQLLDRMQQRNREKAMGTRVALPDETFTGQRVIDMGGERFELIDIGPAHSPGDIVVWLPRRKLVISGDMAFHERLLPVFEHTDTAAWIETWNKFAALGAEIVIPGHGHPTSMDEVTRYTRDYLVYVRNKLAPIIEDGGDLQQAYEIDQSPYSQLATFDILARQNAGRIFRAMEFE